MKRISCHITYAGRPLCQLGVGQSSQMFGSPIPQCGHLSVASANRYIADATRGGVSIGGYFKIVRGSCPE